MHGRIMRSFGADALGQMLNIGIRLLLVPLFLSTWGAESYGEWLILTAFAAWFSLGDLGGQLYFINRMTADWASGRRKDFQRVYSTGLALFVASSSLLFGAVAVLLAVLPASVWLGLKSLDPELAKAILLLMAFRFSISLPVGLLLGIYRAIGLQATSVMYGNLILMIQFVATALALLSGGGMLLLASLEALPFLLLIPILIWDLRRRMSNEFSLAAFNKADRTIMLSAISPSLHFLVLQLSAALMIQGSVIVLAKTLGPVEVAIFSSMRIVANVMSRFIGMFSHASWPELTRLASLGENEKLSRLFRAILLVALFAGLFYLGLIVNYGEHLYRWWLGGKLPYESTVMFLLSTQVILTVMWTWGGNLLMATNRHEGYSRLQVIVNFIALLLCYFFSLNYGLLGGVIGLFAGQYFPMLFIVIWYLTRNGWSEISRDLVISSSVCMLILFISLIAYFG